MVRFWDDYLANADGSSNPYACPLRAASLAALPPALVVTAEFDRLRDEGDAYAHRLSEAGVQTTLCRFDGLIHGFFGIGLI
ncbi:hypothetical protein WS58_16310 [Burkholderia pseudomultivorans]|nr:alpha/beta hydrolase fold domain-containing protein [Burkholderia pseudomultivorans]AOI94108.1 hypothetical protein WS57_34885 [Burkholderia pseudomultivorans]KVC27736.1 hypothetical protein WS55_12680 [Burkholderia pseudomultivorans]KVC36858.1 hypothetical protein WS56_00050 [Burkholderia pseudomultivorans]KVC42099.1 hypothetical protein WS58_16310 [Burkholderia pseudomultivorans]